MNFNCIQEYFCKIIFTLSISITLAACGGGETTQFEEDTSYEDIFPTNEPDSDETPIIPRPPEDQDPDLAPLVTAGGLQLADANVLITLEGMARAVAGASIVNTRWTQVSGPTVRIPTPNALRSTIVTPDVLEPTRLIFVLAAQDSEGRVNFATTTIAVRPLSTFARVVGGVVDESDQQATFLVRLNAAQSEAISIGYSTSDGSAVSGEDYIMVEGELLFDIGETEQTITVDIINSDVTEETEFFNLNISVFSTDNPSSNSGVMLIRNSIITTAPIPQDIAFSNAAPDPILVGEILPNPILASSVLGSGALNYMSSNPQIATVDTEGSVTAFSVGTVTITASVAADSVYDLGLASYTLEIQDRLAPPPPPALNPPGPIVITLDPDLVSVTYFVPSETGGLTQCSGDGLPAGLEVTVSEDGNTCLISGLPATASAATNYFITATNAGGQDTAAINITVNDLPPILTDLPTQILSIGSAIETIVFENTGGGSISSCTATTLPAGLAVNVTQDGTSCEISGLPTALSNPNDFVIDVISEYGQSQASISLEVINIAPQLNVDPNYLFDLFSLINPITLENTGGGLLTECQAINLPLGLGISLGQDENTCVLTGTPVNIGSTTATLIAINNINQSAVDTNITINNILPALVAPPAQIFQIGTDIGVLTIDNGGIPLTSCTATNLPAGLNINVATSGTSCEISGIPTEVLALNNYEVTASNSVGSGTINLPISVENIAPQLNVDPNYLFDLFSPLNPITFENSGGGLLTECQAINLPPGLSLSLSQDENTCVLSGTPTTVGSTIATLTAINNINQSSVDTNITINNILPALVAPAAQIFQIGTDIGVLTLANNGIPLTTCSATNLPAGLNIDVATSGTSCEISGTPTEVLAQNTYEVTASNSAGSDTIILTITVENIAPQLVSPGQFTLPAGETISPITLVNTGGGALTSCVFDSGPVISGLTATISADGNTCEIIGIAASPNAGFAANITATNSAGEITTGANFIFELVQPNLVAPAPLTLFFGEPTSFAINNTGGALITQCNFEVLPEGLTINPSSDATTCEINGSPSAIVNAGQYQINAQNSMGGSLVDIEISVVPRIALTAQAIKDLNLRFPFLPQVAQQSLMVNIDGQIDPQTGAPLFIQEQDIFPSPTPSYDLNINIPLFARDNAEYHLEVCLDFERTDCVISNSIVTDETLNDAIGYFKASNPDANDQYGSSTDLNQSGDILVVGAPLEGSAFGAGPQDNSAPGSGAVYVYHRIWDGVNYQWSFLQMIKAPNGEAGDRFGHAVAISANGNNIAISAPGEDSSSTQTSSQIEDNNNATDAGAVYLYNFDFTSQRFLFDTYVKASNAEAGDQFGSDVDLSNNQVLIVGAPGEASISLGSTPDPADNSAPGAGAAYTFEPVDGWLQTNYMKSSNTESGDNFGRVVALSESGFFAAVASPSEDSAAINIGGDGLDNSAPGSGAVYTFTISPVNGAFQTAYLKAFTTDPGDEFGSALAFSADGLTLAVGAPFESGSATGVDGTADNIATAAGAVYIYRQFDGWSTGAYIKASNTDPGDGFGSTVKLSADGNTLAVGAPLEESANLGINADQTDNSTISGAAYTFVFENFIWSQQSYLKAPNNDAFDNFGLRLSLSSDGRTLAVGASSEDGASAEIGGDIDDNSLIDSGAVFLY